TPSNMQVRPDGMTRMGESPTVHGIPRLVHVPSAQRNCVPAWQLAEPLEYEMPPNWQGADVSRCGAGPSTHFMAAEAQSPSSQRYCFPVWQAAAPSEYDFPI